MQDDEDTETVANNNQEPAVEQNPVNTEPQSLDQLNALLDTQLAPKTSGQPQQQQAPAAKTVEPPVDTPPAEDNPPANNQEPTNTANAAFAKMRVENSGYKKLIDNLAKALNIDASGPDQLTALEDLAIEKIAAANNIAPELQKRLNTLEEADNNRKRVDKEQSIIRQFHGLQEKFGIDEDTMRAFAKELDDDKEINIFDMDKPDIASMYRDRHFEDIVNAKVAAALQAREDDDQAAVNHSVNISGKRGKGGGPKSTVKNVNDLDSLLDSVIKR